MRKTLILAAAAAFAASFAQPAAAGALGGADGVRGAADQLNLATPVHCVPGWNHRRGWPHDGCYRSSYRYQQPYAYTYSSPYAYSYSHPYAYHSYGYRPGVSFGFSVGPRYHWGW